MHRRSPSRPLPFPPSSGMKATPASAPERLVCARDEEIFELCQETLGALQELRHGIEFALYDKLESIDLDVRRLANLIDEDLSVAHALIEKEVDELSTERLIEILEKLQLKTRSV